MKTRPLEIHTLWFSFGGGGNTAKGKDVEKRNDKSSANMDDASFYEGDEAKGNNKEEGEVEDLEFDEDNN